MNLEVDIQDDDEDVMVVSNCVPGFPQYGMTKEFSKKDFFLKTSKSQKFIDFTSNEMIKKEWQIKSKLGTVFSTSR